MRRKSWQRSVEFLCWQGDRVFVSRFCSFLGFFSCPLEESLLRKSQVVVPSEVDIRLFFVPEVFWRLTGAVETQEYKSQQIQQNTLKLLVWIWDSDRRLQKKAECDYLTSAPDEAPDCTNHHCVKKLILLNMRWIISFPENTAGPWTGRPGRSSSLLEAAKWNKNPSGGNIQAASRK